MKFTVQMGVEEHQIVLSDGTTGDLAEFGCPSIAKGSDGKTYAEWAEDPDQAVVQVYEVKPANITDVMVDFVEFAVEGELEEDEDEVEGEDESEDEEEDEGAEEDEDEDEDEIEGEDESDIPAKTAA